MNIIGEQCVYEGTWLTVSQLHCQAANGYCYHWETVQRKQCESVVTIVALLQPSNRYILINQYRPPLDRYVISLPAGIVPYGVSPAQTAVAELKQETGFTGTINSQSPPLAFNAAMSKEVLYVMTMTVDEDHAENQQRAQELEPEEAIDVLLVPRRRIKPYLRRAAQEGAAISAGVWYIFANLSRR